MTPPMNPHQKPQEDVVGNAAKFMRHDGLCAIIGGYGFCSCGRDAAYDALIAAPAYEAGRRDMREAAEWQPIETAPKEVWAKSQQVLTCHAEKRWTRFGRYYGEMKRWYYSGTSERSQWAEVAGDAPTHWMPFPALPTEPLDGDD